MFRHIAGRKSSKPPRGPNGQFISPTRLARVNWAKGSNRRRPRRVKLTNRVCQRCGERFVAMRNDALYCSRACRDSAYNERRGEKAAMKRLESKGLTDRQAEFMRVLQMKAPEAAQLVERVWKSEGLYAAIEAMRAINQAMRAVSERPRTTAR